MLVLTRKENEEIRIYKWNQLDPLYLVTVLRAGDDSALLVESKRVFNWRTDRNNGNGVTSKKFACSPNQTIVIALGERSHPDFKLKVLGDSERGLHLGLEASRVFRIVRSEIDGVRKPAPAHTRRFRGWSRRRKLHFRPRHPAFAA